MYPSTCNITVVLSFPRCRSISDPVFLLVAFAVFRVGEQSEEVFDFISGHRTCLSMFWDGLST